MNLTIAYVTSRKEPHARWFFSSLALQIQPEDKLQIIFITPHVHTINSRALLYPTDRHPPTKIFPPKPNVWQGEYRLTKQDWFAAANARNTAVCYCETEWIAFVDDLCVLEPGWLDCIREAMASQYGVFGAYQKVENLIVHDGKAVSFKAAGKDNRLELVTQDLTTATGSWCYGCSMALPIEWILQVNGFPETLCDGMGFEDVLFGFALQNAGFPLRFDRRMMTIESEEHHHREPAMRREDFGTSPNDKSHRALDIAMQSKYFEQDFGVSDPLLNTLRGLREQTAFIWPIPLAGRHDMRCALPFPIRLNPQHEWFTGKLLSEL